MLENLKIKSINTVEIKKRENEKVCLADLEDGRMMLNGNGKIYFVKFWEQDLDLMQELDQALQVLNEEFRTKREGKESLNRDEWEQKEIEKNALKNLKREFQRASGNEYINKRDYFSLDTKNLQEKIQEIQGLLMQNPKTTIWKVIYLLGGDFGDAEMEHKKPFEWLEYVHIEREQMSRSDKEAQEKDKKELKKMNKKLFSFIEKIEDKKEMKKKEKELQKMIDKENQREEELEDEWLEYWLL